MANRDESRSKSTTEPGQFGPYYLQELVNSGGMAEIWLATDATGKVFALRKLQDNSFFNFNKEVDGRLALLDTFE